MTKAYQPLSHAQMAARVAADIPDGACVNLGIGLPTKVADFIAPDREVMVHSENGVLGIGGTPAPGEEDGDLINAGKQPVTLREGGCFFHSADSFAMMRGGHIDIAVLGAFQVSLRGDLANWHLGDPGAIPAVGGAMDLAVGAKRTFVIMDLLTKSGASKLVERCSYPVTAVGCVSRVYTDVAVFDLTAHRVKVVETVKGVSLDTLRALTGVYIEPDPDSPALPWMFDRHLSD